MSGELELLAGDDRLRCRAAVNCAGLRADEVARLAGDDSFEIYPRKGEFFVFDPSGEVLDRILLPVPEEGTKGVLVFPTLDGMIVAGPTAYDQDDKADWSVRPEALEEVMPKARRMLPQLEGAEPVASYAGLRPAGRGVNYLIGPSPGDPGPDQRRGHPLDRADGIPRDRRARRRAGRRGRRRACGEPAGRASRTGCGSRVQLGNAVVAPLRAALGRLVSRLILGVDEGTTGVKAALFDERLQPVAEARRDKVNRHPQEGWVEQDGSEVLEAVTGAIAELLQDAPGEVVACGLDHQGESILAWDAETGEPLARSWSGRTSARRRCWTGSRTRRRR